MDGTLCALRSAAASADRWLAATTDATIHLVLPALLQTGLMASTSSSGSLGVHWAEELEHVGGPLGAPHHHNAMPAKSVLKKRGGYVDLADFAAIPVAPLQPVQAQQNVGAVTELAPADCVTDAAAGSSHIGRKRSRLAAYGD